MKTAYIFHDAFCDPYSEWYPWMRTTLEGMGYLVVVPKFPTPAGQSYESWKVIIKNHLSTFTPETIFVGHGTGGLFGLRLAEELTQKICGLFLVASYAEPIGNIGYDRINKSFFKENLDWNKVKSNVSTIRVFAGQQDPFVPAAISEHLAEQLGENLETIPDGGHLGKAAGFSQLVPIASRIQESLSELDKSIVVEKAPTDEEVEKTLILAKKPELKASAQPVPSQEKGKPTVLHKPELKAHTMYQDMSHLVNSNRGTVASSLLSKARNEKAVEEATSPVSGKNILYTVLSFLMLAAALGIIIFLVQKYAPAAAIPVTPPVPSLIPAEEHDKLTFSNNPAFIVDQKIDNVFSKPLSDGSIRDIYYITPTGRASFTDLLNVLGVSDLPVGLTDQFPESQNEEPVFMHGLYEKNGVAEHFLVIKIKDYDTAFALMQQWEPTMLRDLGPLMNISPGFLRTRLTRDTFQDEIVQNKNVRTLRYHASSKITLDDTDAPAETSPSTSDSSTDTAPDASTAATGSGTSASTTAIGTVIQQSVQSLQSDNPFADQVSPYHENDLMISYFFLDENTLVITDNLDIIPELLTRWANRQIYQ